MHRLLAILVLTLVLTALSGPASAGTPAPRYTIRWVMVHDHGEAVKQAARDFAARVERETKGDVRVEILSRSEYGRKYKGGVTIGELALRQDVAAGKVEAAQTYANTLVNNSPELIVLSMPYLFRDYAHAESVLDGPIGHELLESFRGKPLRALAFTYSGGFGFFAANRALNSPGDLRGMRLQMMRGRVSWKTSNLLEFEGLGGPPEAFVPLAQSGVAEGLESTYSCFVGYGDDRYAKVITNTGHFLLTTMIVMNSAFFDRLPEAYQRIIERASLDAARDERRNTIALNDSMRRDLERRGIKVVELTATEMSVYREKLFAIYDAPWLSERDRDLIRRIRETGAVSRP